MGVEAQLLSVLTLALNGGEWPVSRLTEKGPSTLPTGGCSDPRRDTVALENKNLLPLPRINHDSSVLRPLV